MEIIFLSLMCGLEAISKSRGGVIYEKQDIP